MPTSDEVKKINIDDVEYMLRTLLLDVDWLGVSAILTMVYELGMVLCSYRLGYRLVLDKSITEMFGDEMKRNLAAASNNTNHNTYNSGLVCKAVLTILKERTVEKFYLGLFGEVEGYDVFESACRDYMNHMLRKWRTTRTPEELASGYVSGKR